MSDQVTYYHNFVQEDLCRRGHDLFIFVEACILESGHNVLESQHNQGECFLFMPSVRKVMQSEDREDMKLKPLPEALELLLKLIKPMNRSFNQAHELQGWAYRRPCGA